MIKDGGATRPHWWCIKCQPTKRTKGSTISQRITMIAVVSRKPIKPPRDRSAQLRGRLAVDLWYLVIKTPHTTNSCVCHSVPTSWASPLQNVLRKNNGDLLTKNKTICHYFLLSSWFTSFTAGGLEIGLNKSGYKTAEFSTVMWTMDVWMKRIWIESFTPRRYGVFNCAKPPA